MNWQLLDQIDFRVNREMFLQEMRIKPNSQRAERLLALCDEAEALARPRALWMPSKIEALDETGMMVNGICFASPLFAPRLAVGQELYFFLATSGAEIDAWSRSYRDNVLLQFWADNLAEKAVRAAVEALEEDLHPFIEDEYMAAMDPGSLMDWPIEEQAPLFKLLGAGSEACGVHLTNHYLMQPQKSLSGFYFSSTVEYYNCELCPRLRCPSRRAEFAGAM